MHDCIYIRLLHLLNLHSLINKFRFYIAVEIYRCPFGMKFIALSELHKVDNNLEAVLTVFLSDRVHGKIIFKYWH